MTKNDLENMTFKRMKGKLQGGEVQSNYKFRL